jgi:hypothetical protein
MFYLDLELPDNTDVDMILNVLENFTTNLEVLGIYTKRATLYES